MQTIILILIISFSLSFAEKSNSAWSPMGRIAYTTSSFSENRGTRYHAGVDWSTEMEEGWPVLAPENGQVERIRQSPFSYGKNLLFRGVSGRVYLFAHLSGFARGLDSLMESEKFRKSTNDLDLFPTGPITRFSFQDTLAFSGSTGIGNPHLHMELRDSSTTIVLDPCANGIACTDSLPPQLLGAAVWDGSGASPVLSLTSASTLQKGCLEVHPDIRDPRIALKIVDYSREPLENPMSVKEIKLRKGKNILFHKAYNTQTYGKMGRIREELLWSEEGNMAGDWHILAKGVDSNENIPLSKMKELGGILRSPNSGLLTLEIRDFINPAKVHSFNPKAKCNNEPDSTLSSFISFQDSTIFTFLSRPWIQMKACTTGKQMSLFSDSGQILVDSLCKEFPTLNLVPLAFLTKRWPKARLLEIRQDTFPVRKIHLFLIPAKTKSPLQWQTDNVSLEFTPYPTTYPNALAWEKRVIRNDRDSTGKVGWIFHPKGLHLKGNVNVCISDTASKDTPSRLYWLGETSRAWFIFSRQLSRTDSTGVRRVCASPDELRDLTFQVDTVPPKLGIPRDTLAMIRGVPQKVVRIPLTEKWAGIPNGNAIEGKVNGRWIPVEFDSEPSEIVVERRWWIPGSKLQLTLSDELENKITVQVEEPPPQVLELSK